MVEEWQNRELKISEALGAFSLWVGLFAAHGRQIVQESGTENVVKGYRVKVDFDTSTYPKTEKKR